MDNLSKVRRISKYFHFLFSVLLIVLPLYYILYWVLINHLPDTLISVNHSKSLVANELPIKFQVIGLLIALLPLSALTCVIFDVRKLFGFYKEGVMFSLDHVIIFKNTAKALLWWVLFSIIYESAKSVLFTAGNPPGSRLLEVGFSSGEFTTLMVGGIVFVIAWVMDEGRILIEENELII
jgi:hypothetical protein